jgi:hypothetical protein
LARGEPHRPSGSWVVAQRRFCSLSRIAICRAS